MRYAFASLGLVLAIGSAIALRWLDEPNQTRFQAQEALDNRSFSQAVALYKQALLRDPASPYRWADLAEAYLVAGDRPRARECFARALQLGPHILPVWVREANFEYQLGKTKEALISSARVLEAVPDYDAVIFSYFDRLVPDPGDVLAQIGADRRATIAYFQHLMDTGNTRSANVAWNFLLSRKFANDKLAASYVDFLLRNHLYDNAVESWTAYVDPRHRAYPERNLLFNGSYESEPTGAAFDWRILPSDKVDTVRDQTNPRTGKWSVHIMFHGDENVAYDNVMQVARVQPGPHRLTAWVRTDAITTNEGIRIRVFDTENSGRLDYKTNPISGTHEWSQVDETVTIPSQTNIITIEVCRIPSQKFDSKIAGSAWIDDVSLTRAR